MSIADIQYITNNVNELVLSYHADINCFSKKHVNRSHHEVRSCEPLEYPRNPQMCQTSSCQQQNRKSQSVKTVAVTKMEHANGVTVRSTCKVKVALINSRSQPPVLTSNPSTNRIQLLLKIFQNILCLGVTLLSMPVNEYAIAVPIIHMNLFRNFNKN